MIVLSCAAVWTARAQEAEAGKTLSPEQVQQRQAVIKKYDTNGNGVLSKSEKKAMSKEDKQILAKTGGVGTAGKAPKSKEAKPDKTKGSEQNRDAKPPKVEQTGKTNAVSQ